MDMNKYLSRPNPTALQVRIFDEFHFFLDGPDGSVPWIVPLRCTTHLEINTWKEGDRTFVCGEYTEVGTFTLQFEAGGRSRQVAMTVTSRRN
jgi:hypothetical protein